MDTNKMLGAIKTPTIIYDFNERKIMQVGEFKDMNHQYNIYIDYIRNYDGDNPSEIRRLVLIVCEKEDFMKLLSNRDYMENYAVNLLRENEEMYQH